MGALLNLLDIILAIGELHSRYGFRGCVLMVVAVVVALVAVIALASVL